MRAIQIALLVICIQVGMGLVTVSGLFGNTYYESGMLNFNINSTSALSEAEQSQSSISFLNTVFDALSWGWIKYYFMPYYFLDAGLRNFVDSIIMFLNTISAFVIGVAFIEFVRNRLNVLG